MQIELLNDFAVFAKHLNFQSAAKELHITQSTLSKHIVALERELGVKLVTRKGGESSRLTPSGVGFLEDAQRIYADYDQALRRCRDLSLRAEPVRLQWFESGVYYHRFLQSLDHSIPFVFEASKPPTGEAPYIQQVEKGAVDVFSTMCGIGSDFLEKAVENAGLNMVLTGEDRVAIITSSSNLLAKKTSIGRDDLSSCDFLVPDGGFFDLWEDVIGSLIGKSPHTVLCPMNGSVENMLYADLGTKVMLYPNHLAERIKMLRDDITVFYEVDGHPLALQRCAVYKSDNSNPCVHAFIDHLEEFFS